VQHVACGAMQQLYQATCMHACKLGLQPWSAPFCVKIREITVSIVLSWTSSKSDGITVSSDTQIRILVDVYTAAT
jgi:hypothetical protein